MAQQRCDYHLFFRALAEDPAGVDAAAGARAAAQRLVLRAG